MTAAEIISATSPAVHSMGSAYYFTPETTARGKELGLDGFRFYFLGRGGVLGDVESPVIVSAFGYFAPQVVKTMWESGRAVIAPREAARAHLDCAHRFGREHFAEVGGLEDFCRAAESVIAAADPAGLALFAGYSAEPLPDDVAARAMHLTVVLRELRGSAHLLALVASGVSPKLAHYMHRPGEFTMFGWSEDEIPDVGDEDRRAYAAAGELTDRLLARTYDVPGASALVDGVERLEAALGPRAT